jgi:uncharacterized protein (DUF362 family)/NAD-dependent dihydropyrimidine dehydrogenase PreA subunit
MYPMIKMEKTPVSISKCSSYELEEVQRAVFKCINALGGVSSIITPGDRVLIKPNMLQAKSPEDAITTHPVLVEAVVNMVKDAGAIPMIGDSPGGPARGMESFWNVTGFFDVSERTSAELVNFEKTGSYQRTRNGYDYRIAKRVVDSDIIINLPKIKTHGLTIFTCAVKNMYGVVPGLIKTEYHKRAPNPSKFAEHVVDIYALSKPHLNIIDGVVGMDGTGPSAGNPKKMGMILASKDGVAVDVLLCDILGKDPVKVPINRIAIEQGLGEGDLNKIEVIGDLLTVDDFKWPPDISGSLDMIPSSLARGIMKLFWSRPAIDSEICTNCKTCVKTCPVDALIENNPIPEFEYGDCINCLCCMEMCPEKAVFEQKSPFSRLISKFRG